MHRLARTARHLGPQPQRRSDSAAPSSSGASSDAAPGVRVRHMPAEKLRAAIRCVMAAAGCPESEQAQVAELLVEANLYGHDSCAAPSCHVHSYTCICLRCTPSLLTELPLPDRHGIQMINKYIKAVKGGFVKPGAQPVITDTGGPILIADANGVWGQVSSRRIANSAHLTALVVDVRSLTPRRWRRPSRRPSRSARAC